MATANSNQQHEEEQADPLAIALEAINLFDVCRIVDDGSDSDPAMLVELHQVAALRTAFAQAAELRMLRNLLVMVANTMRDALEEDNA